MPDEQLLAYIRNEQAKGTPRTEIARYLLAAGCQVTDINAALNALEGGIPRPPTPPHFPVSPSLSAPDIVVTAPIQSSVSPVTPPYAPEAERVSSSDAAPAVSAVTYGGFWVRAAATLIDGLLLTAVNVALVFGIAFAGYDVLAFLVPVVGYAYLVFMIGRYQATLGKMAMGLRIERTNGMRIGYGRALLRELVGKTVSSLALYVGFFMVVWTKKKQGLHDKIADTVVTQKDPGQKQNVRFAVIIVVVVIVALIVVGFLAVVFLASLNAARNKGNDAEVQATAASMQAQSEIYWSLNNSYSIADSCTEGMFASDVVQATNVATLGAKNDNLTICAADGDAYLVAAPLTTGWWCVDSTGTSTSLAEPPATGSYICPSGAPASSTALPGAVFGTARGDYVQGISTGCVESASSDPSYAGISRNAIVSFCSCMGNRIADQTTSAEITEINNLPKDEALPVYMLDRITAANNTCGALLK